MNIREKIERIEALEAECYERFKALKAEVQQEFPQYEGDYWFVDSDTEAMGSVWYGGEYDQHRLSIGNVFKTKGDAEFAAEKLRVEAELRNHGRPFKYNTPNYCIELCWPVNSISASTSGLFQAQGTIYFDSKDEAYQAIESVGEDRIKKYIFGVED